MKAFTEQKKKKQTKNTHYANANKQAVKTWKMASM